MSLKKSKVKQMSIRLQIVFFVQDPLIHLYLSSINWATIASNASIISKCIDVNERSRISVKQSLLIAIKF